MISDDRSRRMVYLSEVDDGWRKSEVFKSFGRSLGLNISGPGGALPALIEITTKHLSEQWA